MRFTLKQLSETGGHFEIQTNPWTINTSVGYGTCDMNFSKKFRYKNNSINVYMKFSDNLTSEQLGLLKKK